MAISVTSDLQIISNCDTTTSSGTFYRLNGPSSANPVAEPDARRQGVACMGYKSGTSLTPTDTGGHFNSTATFSVSGQHVYHWRNNVTAANANTKVNRGLGFGLTNTSTTSTTAWSTTNYKLWLLDGSDTAIDGGWVPYCVDPAGTADASAGTLTLTTVRNCAFISRQQSGVNTGLNNILVDIIYRGTGVTASASSAADTITFDSIWAVDSTLTNAWGILSKANEIYYGLGTINIGSATQTNTCLFKDVGQVLVWRNQPVSSTHYKFNLLGASGQTTTFQLGLKAGDGTVSEGCSIRGAGTAVWNITANANTSFLAYGCAFERINTATLTSTSELSGTSFATCGPITTNNAIVHDCLFAAHTATQLILSQPTYANNITNTKFTSAGTGHAIEITGTAANFTLSGNQFTGYASYQAGGTSTGNEALFINIASGNITISITNGGNTPSYRTAGATVTISNDKTFTISNIVYNSEVRVYRVSNDSELCGVENIGVSSPSNAAVSGPDSSGRYSIAYSHSLANTLIKIIIINISDLGNPAKNYQPYYQEYTLDSASNQSLLVSQIIDRNYNNP